MSRYALCLVALYVLAGSLAVRAGEFQAHVDYATGVSPQGVAVGDFNGDGKPDLVTANGSRNTVSVFLGHGDGTFSGPVDYSSGGCADSVMVGDFNRDAKPDLVVSNTCTNFTCPQGQAAVLLGNGDGTF